MEKRALEKLRIYLILTAGGILQGIAMGFFLFPHAIPSGGAAAITVIVKYLFNVPYEITLWLVNFVLLAAAVKWLGYASTIRTLYTVSVISVTINLCHTMLHPTGGYVWLDLLWGSILMGVGVGLLVRQRASNGGMVILALIVHVYKGYAPGQVMFWVNSLIFFLTGLLVDWSIILLAFINQWLASRIVDLVYTLKIPSTLWSGLSLFSWRRR